MTKDERKKVIKALGLLLDENPDNFIPGIDILWKIIFNEKWSSHLPGPGEPTINITKLMMEESLPINLDRPSSTGRYGQDE